jgi:hypothetical protein
MLRIFFLNDANLPKNMIIVPCREVLCGEKIGWDDQSLLFIKMDKQNYFFLFLYDNLNAL